MPQVSLFNRLWRIVATGFGFSLFGIGGLFLSMIWFTLIRLSIHDQQKCHQITQNSIRLSFCLFLRTMKLLGAFDYQFNDIEQLQNDQGCIIIANHPSLLDYVFIASILPRCDCIVKEALFHNLFIRGVIKTAGYLPNYQAEQLLPLCQQRLKQQGILLIFPEGTRSTPGQKIDLQRGAANIALRCTADIRIISIQCDQPMLTKQSKWYQIPPVKPTFTIEVKHKININEFLTPTALSLAIPARKLTQHLSDILTRQLNAKSESRN